MGNKLSKTYNSAVNNYQGSVLTQNGSQIILTEEGRVINQGGWQYEYDLKDHLGNTRVSFKVDTVRAVPIQYKDYYPFGLEMATWNTIDGSPTKYLYNGKELQDDAGLDWYDYGARFYDPSIGRWHSVDPMAEVYLSITPYAYVRNNPVNAFDPNGMYTMTFNGDEVTGRDKKFIQDYFGLPDDSQSGDNSYDKDQPIVQRTQNFFKGQGFQTNEELLQNLGYQLVDALNDMSEEGLLDDDPNTNPSPEEVLVFLKKYADYKTLQFFLSNHKEFFNQMVREIIDSPVTTFALVMTGSSELALVATGISSVNTYVKFVDYRNGDADLWDAISQGGATVIGVFNPLAGEAVSLNKSIFSNKKVNKNNRK